MTFIPTELNIRPSKELSRAVAAELAKEDDEETKKKLDKLFEGGNDFENKLTQTQAE